MDKKTLKKLTVNIRLLNGRTINRTTKVHVSGEYGEEGKDSNRISAALRRCGVRSGFCENADGSYYYGKSCGDGSFSIDGRFYIE